MSTPSPEQQVVLGHLQRGMNVSCRAVPGAGKTTMAFMAAKSNPGSTLMVTYNTALCESTRARIVASGMVDSMGMYTFHGLAGALTDTLVCDDTSMAVALDIILQDKSHLEVPFQWTDCSLLVVDEMQDARPLYYRLIKAMLDKRCSPRPTILLVGDLNQALYNFLPLSGSDTRFLTLSSQLFPGRQWVDTTLTTSFRLSAPMTRFVNALTPSTRPDIVPAGAGVVPCQLVVCDVYIDSAKQVLSAVQGSGLPDSEILVLLPSLNSRSPAIRIVQMLVDNGYFPHVARSGAIKDASRSTGHDVSAGRIQFKTFFASKGLEAKLVIVINAYQNLDGGIENSLYVALTRATQQLIVLQHNSHCTKATISALPVGTDLSVQVLRPLAKVAKRAFQPNHRRMDASPLFSFIDNEFIPKLVSMVQTTEVHPVLGELADVQSIWSFDHGATHVDVDSMLHSTLLLGVEVQLAQGGGTHSLRLLRRRLSGTNLTMVPAFDALMTRFPLTMPKGLDTLAQLACISDAATSGFVDRLSTVANGQFAWQAAVFARYQALVDILQPLHDASPLQFGLPSFLRTGVKPFDTLTSVVFFKPEHFHIAMNWQVLVVFTSGENHSIDAMRALILGQLCHRDRVWLVNTQSLRVDSISGVPGCPPSALLQALVEIYVDAAHYAEKCGHTPPQSMTDTEFVQSMCHTEADGSDILVR